MEKMAANVGEIEKKQIIRAFQWQTDRIQKRKLSFCNCFESERVYKRDKEIEREKDKYIEWKRDKDTKI